MPRRSLLMARFYFAYLQIITFLHPLSYSSHSAQCTFMAVANQGTLKTSFNCPALQWNSIQAKRYGESTVLYALGGLNRNSYIFKPFLRRKVGSVQIMLIILQFSYNNKQLQMLICFFLTNLKWVCVCVFSVCGACTRVLALICFYMWST